MIDGYKELTPVIYGENAIKYLYTEQKKAEGEICFLLHWHDRMELTYVTEGTLRFVTEGEEFLVSAGKILAYPYSYLSVNTATTPPPPSKELFAALTIASTFNFVISSFIISILSLNFFSFKFIIFINSPLYFIKFPHIYVMLSEVS